MLRRSGSTGRSLMFAAAALVVATGCTSGVGYRSQLQSEDPKQRAVGCKRAGQSGERAAIPLLVDRLEDTDRGVRMFADIALRTATNKDFGWRESDTPAARAEAVRRWRDYARSASPAGGGGR